ncbi:MAG: ATP-dependent RecD-like DNA helicase [Firmicutes bacterium]|nr:ATP-dependent RecD-like DNA helicase [Bacillota bacterium]
MDYYIKGKFKKIVYQNDESNYVVTIFRIKETNDPRMVEYINKTINATGILPNIKLEAPYILTGSYVKHPRYSWQYSFTTFELEKPTTKSGIEEFLASSFVVGCGEATAKKIVEIYGDKALDKIKEDVNNLLVIKGMTIVKAMKIYNSVLNYEKNDQIILRLRQMGFTLEDASRILNKHNYDIDAIMEGNLYLLKDIFDFKKIDDIYISNFDKESPLRCKECILSSMMQISFNEGSTYYFLEEIYKAVSVLYNLNIASDDFLNYMNELIDKDFITKLDKRFYLTKYYNEEKSVSRDLYWISQSKVKKITKLDEKITNIESELGITYNEEQKKAIKDGLNNNVSIISGGPGTGKTTIIKAIVKIYINEYRLSPADIMANIALLAPTGRASKKLSSSTGLPAYTIHRYLKWHKDSDSFEYDENNKLVQKLIIVDETSMIDISLMKSLICALSSDVKLILVGDIYQLPSVGPGLVLQDLINSDLFTYTPLNIIYRQSDNSYIPFLAKDIKAQNIDEEFMYKRDDYNFIACAEEEIVPKILASVKYALNKGINEDKMQILAPMYKGINGIDNLNQHLQEIFNPKDPDKEEISYGDHIYRENDKVLQLVNDSDNSVFNGDIGKIIAIYKDAQNKVIIQIDFDGNIVKYEKKDLKNITHAYAITIHKSQGSEFDHVIMPVCRAYFIMLYNKLLYTGVSRAKTSLTIIGDPRSFVSGIQNNYSGARKTSLIDKLHEDFRV